MFAVSTAREDEETIAMGKMDVRSLLAIFCGLKPRWHLALEGPFDERAAFSSDPLSRG